MSLDTRKLEEGGIFVALRGKRARGEDYVEAALKKGAGLCLVSNVPDGVSSERGGRVVKVRDPYKALVCLGEGGRKRFFSPVIAITGSVGKTTVKHALAEGLRVFFPQVYESEGNYNNHLGVPLCLANMPPLAGVGVVEIGISARGEMLPLTRLVSPDVAVITNIGDAHLGYFEDFGVLVKEKAMIFEGLQGKKVAVFQSLSGDRDGSGMRILNFHASVGGRKGVRWSPCEGGCEIEMGERRWRLGGFPSFCEDERFLCIFATVASVCKGLGLEEGRGLKALSSFRLLPRRGEVLRCSFEEQSFLIVDESYNASSASMRAAILSTGRLGARLGGSFVAVLGDMVELGSESALRHREILPLLLGARVRKVYSIGSMMKELFMVLPESLRGWYAEEMGDLLSHLPSPEEGDIFLVKGSCSMRMDKVVAFLRGMRGV